MTGDCHVRFCERLRGKFPWPTLQYKVFQCVDREKLLNNVELIDGGTLRQNPSLFQIHLAKILLLVLYYLS